MKTNLLFVPLFCAVFCSCNHPNKTSTADQLLQNPERFDTIIEGKPSKLYTLRNSKIAVQITNYGGRIVSLIVPDKNNVSTDVVWGFESIHDYLNA